MPSNGTSRSREAIPSAFSLARMDILQNKISEARTRLESIEQQFPDSALSALARDTLYFVH